jgi:hypothetical protein
MITGGKVGCPYSLVARELEVTVGACRLGSFIIKIASKFHNNNNKIDTRSPSRAAVRLPSTSESEISTCSSSYIVGLFLRLRLPVARGSLAAAALHFGGDDPDSDIEAPAAASLSAQRDESSMRQPLTSW